jgi:arginine utilization regulatory protein
LRERKDDLALLSDHFIKKFNAKFGKNVAELSPAMTAAFLAHHWPGNVRELEHVIESAMNLISSSETTLDAFHFSSSLLTKDIMNKLSLSSPEMYSETRPAASGRTRGPVDPDEPARIIKALESTCGNIAKAAKTLNIYSQLLHHKLKKYGLKKRFIVKME